MDAIPPRPLPTVFGLLRPSVVELRAAPEYFALPRLDRRCAGRSPAEDDDFPRMRRLLATTATSTSTADGLLYASSGSAQDCARYAIISGQGEPEQGVALAPQPAPPVKTGAYGRASCRVLPRFALRGSLSGENLQ